MAGWHGPVLQAVRAPPRPGVPDRATPSEDARHRSPALQASCELRSQRAQTAGLETAPFHVDVVALVHELLKVRGGLFLGHVIAQGDRVAIRVLAADAESPLNGLGVPPVWIASGHRSPL